jgi:8-oxo-dGTP pyrophosphatase MutT (NUDIX family)
MTLVFVEPPCNFLSAAEVALSFVEVEEAFLLLQLSSKKEDAGCWGLPAGKVEPGETLQKAVERELFEETGIKTISNGPSPVYKDKLFIRKPHSDLIYHFFHLKILKRPAISLSREHQNYAWIHRKELPNFPLVPGGEKALTLFLDRSL